MVGVLALATRSVVFAHLRAIFSAAVDDERIAKKPCRAKSVKPPRPAERKVVPWTFDRVQAVRVRLALRYRPTVDVGAGCGLRQGEIFDLAEEDLELDPDGGWLTVSRQVKRIRSRLVFGLPKNDRTRRVPVSAHGAAVLTAHLSAFTPVTITLPWEDPASTEIVTARLIFTTPRQSAINRSTFDALSWKPAIRAVGVPETRENGMHALRHFYASALIDAGKSIKVVWEYIGHADPGFTLRVYAHLMPSTESRTRQAPGQAVRSGARRPSDGPRGE